MRCDGNGEMRTKCEMWACDVHWKCQKRKRCEIGNQFKEHIFAAVLSVFSGKYSSSQQVNNTISPNAPFFCVRLSFALHSTRSIFRCYINIFASATAPYSIGESLKRSRDRQKICYRIVCKVALSSSSATYANDIDDRTQLAIIDRSRFPPR